MGRKKKYQTEEERIAARRESARKWREANPEKVKERNRKYAENNPEKVKESKRKWYEANSEKVKEYVRKWYEENKDDFNAYHKEWIKEKRKKDPILARAQRICDSYRTNDKKYNRGKCALTAKWIIENIFSKPCFYCGETGWEIMGCDRINNDLPHTPNNVVPCCKECNNKRRSKPFEEFCKEMGVKTKKLPPTFIE